MDNATSTNDLERRRQLANALDCFTEDEHLLLSGWTASTAQSKRKHGEGPPYILHGRTYLYPRRLYAEYLQSKVHERKGVPAKEML